jgi:hypothetical protein
METVTLKINEKSKKGQIFLELLRTNVAGNNAVEVIKVPNRETLKAMKEIEQGKAEEITLTQFRKQLGL